MIGLIALLHVSQALPWLDRNWINHQAHREMLLAASAAHFEPTPRLRLMLPVRTAHATSKPHFGIGGPSGM